MSSYITVVSPGRDVKSVKTSLECSGLYNQNFKIRRISLPADAFAIPTNLHASEDSEGKIAESEYNEAKNKILCACGNDLSQESLAGLTFATVKVSACSTSSRSYENTLHSAVAESVNDLNGKFPTLELPKVETMLSTLSKSFSLYPPMLLLPHNVFDGALWDSFFSQLQDFDDAKELFFYNIASRMHVTHVAMDAPIPSRISSDLALSHENAVENVIRSPHNLKPLYGDFGTACPAFPAHKPTSLDFEKAFWVTTRQNGVTQIWAPRYTMFSTGNVTEKARLLHLASVKDAVAKGNEDGQGSTAIDLFAGIGYFAFSYAKAGVSNVLCWDLNPWSIEGLRRGVKANKWQANVFDEGASCDPESFPDRSLSTFWVFSESNSNAHDRIRRIRSTLPPIRHVNCGMLPSAGSVWQTAVEAVDPHLGGWVHLHETVFDNAVEKRGRIITEQIRSHLNDSRQRSNVRLEHVEKVKSIGPRLLHVVLDIWIPPRDMATD